jgi:hypothetical protein
VKLNANENNGLSLFQALKEGKLPEFVAREEARGIGPADIRALDALVAEAAKEPQLEDQASRFPSGDGLTEK